MELNILPTPRKISRHPGWYKKPLRLLARGSAQVLRLVEHLGEAPGSNDLPQCIDESRLFKSGTRLFIGAPQALSQEALKPPPRNGEGYRLEVGSSWFLINAKTERGLFYGVMSLRQLLRNHSRIPCCVIEDWPDMPVRGIHLDLKGCTPTVDYVKDLIPRLAQYKINTLLMEYEDAVQLDCLPGVAKPSAWSKEDVEDIAAVARSHYIELMPLVQGLGHVQYILRHEAYARYRETPGAIQQYCPSNPATLALWKQQADEIIELFPDSRYFHVGMDETRQLGQCARCRKKIGRNGDPLNLFLRRLEAVCAHIDKRGYKPIFWDDMISRHASNERLGRLPQNAAVMIWLYYMFSDSSRTLNVEQAFYGQRAMFNHEWLQGQRWHETRHARWLDEMPSDISGRYLRFAEDRGRKPFLRSNPFIDMFAERGVEILGASAAKTNVENFGLPDLAMRLDNVRSWGRQIARAKQTGVISTAWSRANSLGHPGLPIDTMWYTMCASAQFYWSAEGASIERFQDLFDREFFGVEDDGWTARTLEAATSVASNAALTELKKLSAVRNQDILETHQLLGQFSIAIKRILRILPRHLFSLYPKNHAFPEETNPFSKGLAQELRALGEMRPAIGAYYQSVMLPEEAQELIDSQFTFLAEADWGIRD